MRPLLVAVLAALAMSTARGGTGGTEPEEPVNLIAETGLDIGPCASGGSLTYPPAPYKGTAFFLPRADATLAARHESLTRRQAPWLRHLAGPSGSTRLFSSGDSENVIVFWSCKAGDCDANVAYGAYGLQSKDYLLELQEGHRAQTLGDQSAPLLAAIACARTNDDRRRGNAAEATKRSSRP